MNLDDAIESLKRYEDYGIATGSFLEAVLRNDLFEAVARADDESMANLPAICRYVYNDMPAPCWGSPAKVNAWIDAKHEARKASDAATP